VLTSPHHLDLALAGRAALDLGAVFTLIGVAVVAEVEVRALRASVTTLARYFGRFGCVEIWAAADGGLVASVGVADEFEEIGLLVVLLSVDDDPGDVGVVRGGGGSSNLQRPGLVGIVVTSGDSVPVEALLRGAGLEGLVNGHGARDFVEAPDVGQVVGGIGVEGDGALLVAVARALVLAVLAGHGPGVLIRYVRVSEGNNGHVHDVASKVLVRRDEVVQHEFLTGTAVSLDADENIDGVSSTGDGSELLSLLPFGGLGLLRFGLLRLLGG